jgi:hypothetical protein
VYGSCLLTHLDSIVSYNARRDKLLQRSRRPRELTIESVNRSRREELCVLNGEVESRYGGKRVAQG